ncbi:MAG TPA: hypothetical protein ENK85_07340 [Saprospiraceae bacterium]|nr:hypothetical protein [Saprospiraceae bacterium]
MKQDRYIGAFEGGHGPLVIAVGGMHGNELAGVHALRLLFKMLKEEPLTNPGFEFKGRIIGLYGNKAAIKAGKRYIDVDLNRQWTRSNIEQALSKPPSQLRAEEKEMVAIYQVIKDEIKAYKPTKIILLDLHTTSAEDGIFSIPTGTRESYELAKGLFAPVISNLTETLHGTFMQFFDGENLGIPTVTVTFESGQHDDPLSINRSVAAIVNCLRFIHLVKPEDVESRHDDILKAYTKHLPKLAKLAYKHQFRSSDSFKMHPGYRNFTPIKKGEYLADDVHGKILSPLNGYVLMPLYQVQGSEGFFIVTEE